MMIAYIYRYKHDTINTVHIYLYGYIHMHVCIDTNLFAAEMTQYFTRVRRNQK